MKFYYAFRKREFDSEWKYIEKMCLVKSTTKLNDNIKEFIQTVQELKKNGVSVWLAKYDCLAEELLEELKPLIEKITKKQ